MRGALGGPRVMLRRLREVMAEPVSAQERLDKVVVLIAANMVAEVCSVYVLRVDGTLELYATEGLKHEAVHQTVLKADEGLVGLVASEANPINLSDVQAHPAFSFRPETGEEIYRSFLGVPILRAGNMLGVLVVQNRSRRTYTEEEEEALQTTAMVVAEMIASGELSIATSRPAKRRRTKKKITIVSRSEILPMEPSKASLVQVKDLLDGCVGLEVEPQNVGNRTQLPIHSSILETIKIVVDAGIRIHQSPLITRHHVTMLERVRAILIEYNKTLEVLNGSVSKTTKLFWGISKLATLVAIPTAAVFTNQLSSAVATAIGSLGAAIVGCRAALGI
jgi:putative methionine-R-sulfoxide reductase with GAF domain